MSLCVRRGSLVSLVNIQSYEAPLYQQRSEQPLHRNPSHDLFIPLLLDIVQDGTHNPRHTKRRREER